MWTFKQVGQSNSLIQTRIRGGVTPRPRDHGWYITCDPQYVVSQWSICVAIERNRCSPITNIVDHWIRMERRLTSMNNPITFINVRVIGVKILVHI